jgi:hypothetical protein
MPATGRCHLDWGLTRLGRGLIRLAAGGEPLRPRAWCPLGGEPAVDVGEVIDTEIPPRLQRRTSEGQITIPCQEDHLVTPVGGCRLVGGEDNRDPSPGEPAQQAHDLCRCRWVQTRGGLIQEEGARLGQQLDRDAGPLALTARQHPDRNITPVGQVQVAHRFVNHVVGLLSRCARRQAQSCRVLERTPQRHLEVDDVVLRDIADARAGRGAGIDPNAVMHDLASRWRPHPRKDLEQGPRLR